MKYRQNTFFIIVMSSLFILMLSRPAYAYIDPGSAGFIIQMLIGAVCGMLFGVKIFWQQIKFFFLHLFSRGKKSEDEKE